MPGMYTVYAYDGVRIWSWSIDHAFFNRVKTRFASRRLSMKTSVRGRAGRFAGFLSFARSMSLDATDRVRSFGVARADGGSERTTGDDAGGEEENRGGG